MSQGKEVYIKHLAALTRAAPDQHAEQPWGPSTWMHKQAGAERHMNTSTGRHDTMWSDQTQSSGSATGETHLRARTTTHTLRLKAPLGNVGAQHKETLTGEALQLTVLYIRYGDVGLQEGQHRPDSCVAKSGIVHATRGQGEGYTDQCVFLEERPRPSRP